MENQQLPIDGEIPVEEQPAAEDTATEDGALSELEALREQVKKLTDQLREKTALTDKITAQIGEFTGLFPEVAMEDVPDEVWDSVKSGSSLAAAYALYTRRVYMNEQRTSGINKRNALQSSGYAGKGTASEYFSPDEVRAMSQREVRENYSKIIESMKKWN